MWKYRKIGNTISTMTSTVTSITNTITTNTITSTISITITSITITTCLGPGPLQWAKPCHQVGVHGCLRGVLF